MKNFKNVIKFALFTGGLVLFVWSIRNAGLERLGTYLPALYGPGVLALGFYPFIAAWDVWGWRAAFPPTLRSRVPFGDLFMIRLAGEALNNLTPFVDIGGEPLKVILLSQRLGIDKRMALASAIMARTALFFSEVLFWGVGLALLFIYFPVSHGWTWPFLGSAGVFVILGLGLYFAQKRGFFLTFLRWFERLPVNKSLFERFEVSLKEIDAEIASFYRPGDNRLVVTVAWHFTGWVAGGIEMFLFFKILGAPISLVNAMALEALLQLVKTASFFIPGNLGAQEAGMALFAQWMGFHPSLGVAVSLLKRIRQLIWTAAGFAVWGFYRKR